MGRSMNETLKEYEWFVENGVQLKFLKEPMINTSDEEDDIIKQAIQKVILTVLAAFAEKERLDIKTRQDEGIEEAKAKGRHLGRPKAKVTPEVKQAYDLWINNKITAVEAIDRSKVSKTTFYKLAKELKSREES